MPVIERGAFDGDIGCGCKRVDRSGGIVVVQRKHDRLRSVKRCGHGLVDACPRSDVGGLGVHGLDAPDRFGRGPVAQLARLPAAQQVEHLLDGGTPLLVDGEPRHDDADERLVGSRASLRHLKGRFGFDAVGRSSAQRLQVKRGMAAIQFVEHARERIDVDGGAQAPGLDARDIVGEHLGWRVLGRAAAPDVGAYGKRGVDGVECRGTAKVDEADIEVERGELVLERALARGDHDVARRDVAVGNAGIQVPYVIEDGEHGHADGRYRVAAHAAVLVGELWGDVLERGTLDPFHDDERLAVAGAVAVYARKTLKVRDGELVAIFLEQHGAHAGGDALVRGVAHVQAFDGKDLAGGVGGALDYTRAALTGLALDEKHRETAARLVALGGIKGNRGLKRIEYDELLLSLIVHLRPLGYQS